MHGLFEPGDGRMTDAQVISVSEVPSQTPSPEMRRMQDRFPRLLRLIAAQTSGLTSGRFTPGHAG